MGVIAEMGLRSERFPLADTLDEFDDLSVDIERVAAHGTGVMPFVRFETPDGEIDQAALERGLAGDSSVRDFQRMTTIEGKYLYQIAWSEWTESLLDALVHHGGAVLSTSGDTTGWTFRVLFPDRDALSETYDECEEHNGGLSVHRIYQVDEGEEGRLGITTGQLEALEAAFEHGYYSIPREISLEELADILDVSHQALSEQLRRAHQQVVRSQIVSEKAKAEV